jgi:bifunctional UDP-N-acetylglucosamine pyrophosphorylase / glucosamine-1-phosphate N-acetyltransferase
MGYGNVVATGSLLRKDFLEEHQLIIPNTHLEKMIHFRPRAYANINRIVGNNIMYLANLMALGEWYIHVRRPFFNSQEFGHVIFSGLLDKLVLAKRPKQSYRR